MEPTASTPLPTCPITRVPGASLTFSGRFCEAGGHLGRSAEDDEGGGLAVSCLGPLPLEGEDEGSGLQTVTHSFGTLQTHSGQRGLKGSADNTLELSLEVLKEGTPP